ncbi:MAG TPA: ATP-binding protein [Candidatus Polarisedimenticolia bacterium]|nr:ATP-binding protein [Candidatus Polarisedimenticolia bacterium]
MTSAFLLLVEGLVLAVFCLDLGWDFALLPASARVGLLLVGAAAVMVHAWPRARAPFDEKRRPALVLGVAVLCLGSVGLLQGWLALRLAGGWDAGARSRLEGRAVILQEDFGAFLEEIEAPPAFINTGVHDPAAAFKLLEEARRESRLPGDRHGLAIYNPDGSLLAWEDASAPAPPDLLAAADAQPTYRIAGGEVAPRLFVVRAAPSGLIWVGEFLLRSPAGALRGEGADLRLDLLPRWDRATPAHLQVHGGAGENEELARFFERQADRYWGRLGRDGLATLSFPLRTARGATLAIVTLTDRRPEDETRALRRGLRQGGALLAAAAILLAAALSLRPGPSLHPTTRFALATFSLWSARSVLLLVGGASDLPRLSLYDITLYASSGWFGLLRSPADLLLTAIACLAQARILRLALASLPPPSMSRRRAAALVGIATFLTALVGTRLLHRGIDQIVLDARLDISRVSLESPCGPRLALQISLFLMVMAFVRILLALFDLTLRWGGVAGGRPIATWLRSDSPERIPIVLRTAIEVLLLTLLYAPFLHHAYDRLRQDFFDRDLAPRVLHQQEARRQILREALAQVRDPEFAAGAAFAEEDAGEGAGSVAYPLWARTTLAESGLASSLQIHDREGRLLSRFAVNLAPMLEIPFSVAAAAAGGDLVTVEPRAEATVRKRVIFGAYWIRPVRRPALLVVMTVVDHFDNLPMLGSDTSHLQTFGSRGLPRSNPELLRFDPMLAVFGPRQERIEEWGGEIPPPGPGLTATLAKDGRASTIAEIGDGPARILYLRGGSGLVFALAYSHPSAAEALADYLRLALLNGLLAVLLLAVLGGWRRLSHGRASHVAPGATFYRRLLTVFLLSALLPLLALAYFISRFSDREFARDLTASGLGSLQVARRVAEDYLTVSGPEAEAALDDDVVFWLSRVVRQDINVFHGADLLATSTRELYSSGLLNTRLDGEAYRTLYLEADPYWQGEEEVGGMQYLTLSAPMRIDRAGTTGVISIPLAAQRRAVARKAEEVEDAILISTCVTILLLAAVGYLVSRGISGPIAELAHAAQRVAGGDLDVRVRPGAPDETGILVDSFNRMATALRAQRQDLEHRRDYIEKILASVTTGVLSTDAEGAIITINPAARSLLGGASAGPAPGENLSSRLLDNVALGPLRAALTRSLSGSAAREVDLSLPRGASERRVRAVFIPFTPEEGAPPGRIVILEDVTEIVRSGRLAAWAEMARRIAHEIKNPLTPIQLSVEHLRRLRRARDARFETVLPECLDNIERQVRVLRQIAAEFSVYARHPELRTETIQVDLLLDEALGPYSAAPPSGVTLRREVRPGTPAVRADRTVIGRALVNLIENALQAMPEGGVLTVSAAVDDTGGGPERVRIEVRDTGAGIDPALLPRLFEPYFSTKSGGTGLGLSIARRAVEEHGGTIVIDSRPGAGTVVALTLPIAPPRPPGEGA